jgi:hypothetical protein
MCTKKKKLMPFLAFEKRVVTWNFNLLYTLMPNEVKEHLSNLPVILNSEVADCHTWKGNLNGIYTARDGYHWLNRYDFTDNSTDTVT